MQYSNGPKAFTVGTGGVSAYCLVKLSAGTIVANTATDSDCPIGIALDDGSAGDVVSVAFLNKEGTHQIKAAGAITINADVYAAADGEIQALPAAAADYKKIGIALQAASGDGSIIEVLAYDYHTVTTVS